MYMKAMLEISVFLSLSQLAKMLCPSYYCLYSLLNKIRDKVRTVSAWKQGGRREREGGMGRGREQGVGGRNGPNIVCTYEYATKK
jgi:hypothetical protein